MRFKLIRESEAIANGYPEVEAGPWGDDGATCLYEMDGDRPVRLVATDGGEPEDQTFFRNWKWVVVELNKLAAQLEEATKR